GGCGRPGESAQARPRPALRPAVDRSAYDREYRARWSCRPCGDRRLDHRRGGRSGHRGRRSRRHFHDWRTRGRGPMSEAPRPLSIYIIAGEESGDALGAALARALGAATGGAVKLAGVGGRAMAAAGIESSFSIDDLSIVGLTT